MAEHRPSIDRHLLGMGLFISSEALFFLGLIAAYVLYRGHALAGPGAVPLDIPRTALFTGFLLASSATVQLAARRLRADDRRGCQGWLLATVLCGTVFLAGQATEYARLLHARIAPSYSLAATTFFTLTGFHGLHVLVGLLALLIVLGLALAGDVTARRRSGLEAVSLYWHFVDGVWVAVFSVVYLWTLL